jgi:YesN/AraC family two-component response regulator
MVNKISCRNTILVLAEKYNQKLYRILNIEDTNIEIYSCKEDESPLRRIEPSFVIIDCGFEIELGLKVLEKIKNVLPSVPVILITDKSSEEHAIQAFRLGAREYLRKPIDIFELQDTIQEILKLKRDSRERRVQFVPKIRADSGEFLSFRNTDKPVNLLASLNYIEQNFTEEICLSECAKIANLSKYHFCRLFKKHMGLSPMEYVNMRRIIKAKDLFSREDYNNTEISLTIGFNDYGTFLRNFKKITGLTPKKYRESLE